MNLDARMPTRSVFKWKNPDFLYSRILIYDRKMMILKSKSRRPPSGSSGTVHMRARLVKMMNFVFIKNDEFCIENDEYFYQKWWTEYQKREVLHSWWCGFCRAWTAATTSCSVLCSKPMNPVSTMMNLVFKMMIWDGQVRCTRRLGLPLRSRPDPGLRLHRCVEHPASY